MILSNIVHQTRLKNGLPILVLETRYNDRRAYVSFGVYSSSRADRSLTKEAIAARRLLQEFSKHDIHPHYREVLIFTIFEAPIAVREALRRARRHSAYMFLCPNDSVLQSVQNALMIQPSCQ